LLPIHRQSQHYKQQQKMRATTTSRKKLRVFRKNNARQLPATSSKRLLHRLIFRKEKPKNTRLIHIKTYQRPVAVAKRKLNQREKRRDALSRKKLHKKRKRYGVALSGRLKRDTPVFFRKIKAGPEFRTHPIFPKVPNACIRLVPKGPFKKLRDLLEKEIEPLATERPHLDANTGIQLGMSVTRGGRKGNTIQWGNFMKNKPELRRRLCQAVKEVLESTFGQCFWYRRLLDVTKKLAKDSGEQRTLPGLPCTGIWYTMSTRENGIHCDGGSVGASFLMSTRKVEGGHINLQLPGGNFAKRKIEPEECLGGRWSENAHCNTEVDPNTAANRRTIVLYLNRAAFSKAYKYNTPRGFKP